MGCDGGTIPKRDELVRVQKKPEKKDKVSELSFKWQHCNVSQEPLRKPIVACQLGSLYNKDTIIENLLDRSSVPEAMSHIKTLKDIKDINLVPNPSYKDEPEKGGMKNDHQAAPYICPISRLEMNGIFKFCFFWTCGCVLSERALKQFSDNKCPLCQKTYTEDDIIIMNATDDDLKKNLERREKRIKLLKAIKKNKAKVKAEPVDPSDQPEQTTTVVGKSEVKTETMVDKKPDVTNIKLSTASESSSSNIKKDGTSTSKFSSKRTLEQMYDPAFKKLKSSYSVTKDPNATEVYKSLFTSSSDAKKQGSAHWVTFNPFYN